MKNNPFVFNANMSAIGKAQHNYLDRERRQANPLFEEMFMGNAAFKPRDLYQGFDDQTVQIFNPIGENEILARLMPLGISAPIGKHVISNARGSGNGKFVTSMEGQEVFYDNSAFDTDGAILPMHQNGFKRDFREHETLTLEGFDGLLIDQAEAMLTHRRGLQDYFLNGGDQNVDGITWKGFRGDERVDQIDLSAGDYAFDYTNASGTLTGADYVAAFTKLASRRFNDMNIGAPATFFVSNQVYWSMAADYSDAKGDGTIMDRLRKVPGVADFVPTSDLQGNEILSMPLSSQYVRPIVAQAVSTVALPRLKYRDPLAFDIWSVIGIQVRTDYQSRHTAIQMAKG